MKAKHTFLTQDTLARCYLTNLEAHHSFVFLRILVVVIVVMPLTFLGHKHTAPTSCLLMFLCHSIKSK